MTLYKELSYDGQECVSKIKGIQFCILGPDEIRTRSVAEITKTDTYAINEPVPNGLFDSRMGVIDNNKICKTCEQRNTFCPGHFGHIEMSRPLFYLQFFGIVQKLLRCVCFRCSKILVDLRDPGVQAILTKKHSRMKRWEHMHKLCSNVKRCGKETIDGCGARQPDRVAKTDAMKILMEWKDLAEGADDAQEQSLRRQVYGADDVLRILKRITDEDSDALGFYPKYNRPEWMICTVLPVPPPCVRPSVRNDTGVRKEDDLTHKLGDIIKYNNLVKLKIEKGASYDSVEWCVAALQQHVATLIDNTGSFVSKDRTGRIFRTICDRLNRKEGRIRGNLMGKRVDFSARTVITPDPNISIDELGVPLRIAMNLTFPEVVNSFNIDLMYRLVRNGPDVYPGAKHLRKLNRTIRLKGNDRDAIVLEHGDIVERHLINGDYVLFNRQPSLHKMSMMAHRVRVMPHNTFRLNVCVCASYNADFDGDEMNMHVPQSLQSHEEIVQLAAVPLHIISPRHSKPIISIVQDVALGVFRITQSHVSVTKKQLCNLVCSNPVFTGTLPPPGLTLGTHERWTGRQLLSTIIPPTTMLSMFPDKKSDEEGFLPDDHHVRVKCGELKSGVLTTEAFNNPARGLIRNIVNDGGPETVTLFLNNTQKIICDWLVLSGFSVGISDLLAPAYKRERIKQQVVLMHAGVEEKIASLHAGEMKNVSTLNNRAFFESQIDTVTKSCIRAVEKAAFNDIDVRNNRMYNMIKSGSKGQPVNFMQMLACLGQQVIDGHRIPDGFDHRTLPHFTKYDDGPSSRGFVEHSFVEGLTPQEFFFHSMAGRVGLIDTAVRTSETGYIQRKLVTFMQDLKVHTDLTVRNSAGQIVQFLYGEDGIDATKVEYQILPYVEHEVHAMRADNLLLHISELAGAVTTEVLARPLDAARMTAFFDQLVRDREYAIEVKKGQMDNQVMHPVNMSIMVLKAAELMEAHGAVGASDIHPNDVLDIIDDLIRDLCCSSRGATKFMAMLLRCHLSPKQLIVKRRFTRAVLDVVVKQIRTRYFESIAHPGEMVGILAAQSIGEPTTQTTLNTFHLAGVGAASITTQQGVPRLQELFHVSKNIKTPYMKIYVRDTWSTDMSRCRNVCSAVQTTRFRDVVRHSKVYFDPPNQEFSNIDDDRALLKAFDTYTAIMGSQCSHESPWVVRFEFDRTKMLELQVCMLDLETILREFYDDTIACVFSDDNAANLVARVRLNNKDIDANDMLTELRALEDNILQTVVIKGVKNIEKAVPLKPSDQLIYDKMTSTFVKLSEWAIETSGTNLIEVLSLPHVDPVRTYSNDINEIYHVLGIEAARQALYNELQAVMWQKDTNSVNYRHMALLVDAMTSRGFLTSVNRHGINKGDIGPLAKCSFEQTTEMLIQAGVFSELDRINGVAANIILGQVAPCGTGDSEILIDESALQLQGHEVPVPYGNRRHYNDGADISVPRVAMPPQLSQLPQLPVYAPGSSDLNGKIDSDDLEII